MMPPITPDEDRAVMDVKVYCYACGEDYEQRIVSGEPTHALCPKSPGFTGGTGTLGQEGHRTTVVGMELVPEEEAEEWLANRGADSDAEFGIDYSNRR